MNHLVHGRMVLRKTAVLAPILVIGTSGWAHAQVRLDLAVQKPGTTLTLGVPVGEVSVRIVNMVPEKQKYDLALRLERIPLPDLPVVALPWLKGLPGVTPEANVPDPCADLKATIQGLKDVDDEPKVPDLVRKVSSEIDKNACGDPATVAVGQRLMGQTTMFVPSRRLGSGEQLTVTIVRQDGTHTWSLVLTTEPRGKWVTTYGFAFGPDKDDLYFSKAKDGGKFTITRQTESAGVTMIPSVFFSWLSAASTARDWTVAPTAGIGVAKDRPAVMAGLAFTFNHNIGFVLGGSIYGQRRLSGQYDANQEIGENLGDAQLHSTVPRPALVFAATFRFGSSPFSSDGDSGSAQAAKPATPSQSAERPSDKPVEKPKDASKEKSTESPVGAEASVGDSFRLSYSERGELVDAQSLPQIDQSIGTATDVFVLSHGWWNNKETAECRYGVMIDALRARAPAGTRPVFIGIYWPSAVFPLEHGDCESGGTATAEAMSGGTFDNQIRHWATEAFPSASRQPLFQKEVADLIGFLSRDRLGQPLSDTELSGLAAILSKWQMASGGATPADEGPETAVFEGEPSVIVRRWQARLGASGPAEAFKARKALEYANAFTFWAMKGRAGVVGSAGVFDLVKRVRERGGDGLRIHLVGHSFGAKLMSAAAAGRVGATNLVDSLILLQGAFSHFAFASAPEIRALGVRTDRPGVYSELLLGQQRGLRGGLVAMHSAQDDKNRVLYPIGVTLTGDFLEANIAKYGSVGADGVLGPKAVIVTLKSEKLSSKTGAGLPRVVNVDATDVVRGHSDITHPEVFEMIWDAVRAQIKR